MNKKFGFTLAEVLVTLGIIGVIASLTMPSLVRNTGSAQTGPILAKFVNTYQNAAQKAMIEQSMPLISSTDVLTDLLSTSVIMAPMVKEHTFTNGDGSSTYSFSTNENKYKKSDGSYVTETALGNAWLLNDGPLVTFIPAVNQISLVGKGSYKKLIGLCLVDTNGYASPNKAGSDVFAFIIDDSGVLIPAGGSAHKYVDADVKVTTHGTIKVSHTQDCDRKSAALSENFSCTGQIADNNWQVVD